MSWSSYDTWQQLTGHGLVTAPQDASHGADMTGKYSLNKIMDKHFVPLLSLVLSGRRYFDLYLVV